jgi:hypothetical protein
MICEVRGPALILARANRLELGQRSYSPRQHIDLMNVVNAEVRGGVTPPCGLCPKLFFYARISCLRETSSRNPEQCSVGPQFP